MKKNTFLIFIVLILVSCTTDFTQTLPLSTIGSIRPSSTIEVVSQSLAINESILIPPKIENIDWKVKLSPLVQRLIAVDDIKNGSLLLVNTIKNSTNGALQVRKATMELTKLIKETTDNKFQIIGIGRLNAARHDLGLSINDSLESHSKAIGLGRYLNAQYVLYSTAVGNSQQPDVDLQLILVKTGEIIWFGRTYAKE